MLADIQPNVGDASLGRLNGVEQTVRIGICSYFELC